MSRIRSVNPWFRVQGKDSDILDNSFAGQDAAGLFEDVLLKGAGLRVRVTGQSMAPFLRGGELVTIRREQTNKLRRGDLVFFRDSRGCVVLHRLLSVKNAGRDAMFTTKGDALFLKDEPVGEDQVLGRVAAILNPDGKTSLDMMSLRSRIVSRALYLMHRTRVFLRFFLLVRRALSARFPESPAENTP